MVQGYGLTEEDFRGERFAAWECNLRGCNDALVLTRPDIIAEIHEKYLSAGADIISTDSFNANSISLADYALSSYAREIAQRSAEIAREVADRFTARNPHKPRFVAGSVGPTEPATKRGLWGLRTVNRSATSRAISAERCAISRAYEERA